MRDGLACCQMREGGQCSRSLVSYYCDIPKAKDKSGSRHEIIVCPALHVVFVSFKQLIAMACAPKSYKADIVRGRIGYSTTIQNVGKMREKERASANRKYVSQAVQQLSILFLLQYIILGKQLSMVKFIFEGCALFFKL